MIYCSTHGIERPVGVLAGVLHGSPASTDFLPLLRHSHFPAAERVKLRELVKRCHDAGQRLRFWATPDQPGAARDALWRELVAADVDQINTDDLAGLAAFLRNVDR